MSEHLELRGRCAVITGAASGIGRALALEAAARGMSVAICDQNTEGLEAVATELRDRQAVVLAQTVDVRSAPALAAFADKVFDQFPDIALVFANAGLMRVDSAVRPTPDVWALTLGVNVLGIIHVSAAFLDRMIKRGQPAQYVVTASQAAFLVAPTISAYAASKHAIWGYAEALREELKMENSPVEASMLSPGRVASALTMETRERVRAGGGDAAAAQYETLLMPSDILARFAFDQAEQRKFWILPAKDFEVGLPPRIKALLDPSEPHAFATF
jgi:NADP-dependent 3-hydroxy acid dehydrogenase YdfG